VDPPANYWRTANYCSKHALLLRFLAQIRQTHVGTRTGAAALQNCGRRKACPFVSDCFGAQAWKEGVPKSVGAGVRKWHLCCSACRAETVRLPFSVSQTAKKPAVAERCVAPARDSGGSPWRSKALPNGNCAETVRRRAGIKASESKQKTRIRMKAASVSVGAVRRRLSTL
jgi:hypothetical protein